MLLSMTVSFIRRRRHLSHYTGFPGGIVSCILGLVHILCVLVVSDSFGHIERLNMALETESPYAPPQFRQTVLRLPIDKQSNLLGRIYVTLDRQVVAASESDESPVNEVLVEYRFSSKAICLVLLGAFGVPTALYFEWICMSAFDTIAVAFVCAGWSAIYVAMGVRREISTVYVRCRIAHSMADLRVKRHRILMLLQVLLTFFVYQIAGSHGIGMLAANHFGIRFFTTMLLGSAVRLLILRYWDDHSFLQVTQVGKDYVEISAS